MPYPCSQFHFIPTLLSPTDNPLLILFLFSLTHLTIKALIWIVRINHKGIKEIGILCVSYSTCQCHFPYCIPSSVSILIIRPPPSHSKDGQAQELRKSHKKQCYRSRAWKNHPLKNCLPFNRDENVVQKNPLSLPVFRWQCIPWLNVFVKYWIRENWRYIVAEIYQTSMECPSMHMQNLFHRTLSPRNTYGTQYRLNSTVLKKESPGSMSSGFPGIGHQVREIMNHPS